MTQHQLIESTAIDIIAAIREHGPTRDVIVPRLEKLMRAALTHKFCACDLCGAMMLPESAAKLL